MVNIWKWLFLLSILLSYRYNLHYHTSLTEIFFIFVNALSTRNEVLEFANRINPGYNEPLHLGTYSILASIFSSEKTSWYCHTLSLAVVTASCKHFDIF